MANTAEGDFAYAAENYSTWQRLQALVEKAGADPDLLREAYETAWSSGFAAGEREGSRQQAQGGW